MWFRSFVLCGLFMAQSSAADTKYVYRISYGACAFGSQRIPDAICLKDAVSRCEKDGLPYAGLVDVIKYTINDQKPDSTLFAYALACTNRPPASNRKQGTVDL